MKLKKDIYNLMNRKQIYARAGDEVQMIGAILVLAKDGSRFSVRAEDLEESGGIKPPDKPKTKPEPPKSEPTPPVAPPVIKRSKKDSKQDYSPTLF